MPAAITDKFNESTTNGRPVAAALTAQKIIGATTLTVDSTADWPTATAVHFTMFKIDANNAEITNTRTDWKGIVASSTSITNLTLQAGTDIEYPIGSKVICAPTAAWADDLIEGITVEHNQDGTHDEALITSRTEDTDPDPDADFVLTYDTSATALKKAKLSSLGGGDGWIKNVLPSVSSVTANGNRSYDVTFSSSVASTLSEGMRLQFTKTVAGNGYMGGLFNGSSHYFIKTSPTGALGTVTNNFSIAGWVEPTSYADGAIASRCDAAANNLLEMRMGSAGQLRIQIASGGSANIRYVDTYRSLALSKKQFCVMTWSSGTVTAYIDGESVTVTSATTGGTAPTTAGTGGDFAIGRRGASANLYFAGYSSDVQVYDKVLSEAEVKALYSQIPSGSETNCIGSWSLDNTANDQSSLGNNLTATGGVGFTTRSPHGQLGNGVETTKAVALVMSVSGSTATVQVPEGCTIPTSGGITSVAYSTQANPYGWVSDKGRWGVSSVYKTLVDSGAPTSGTWYNTSSAQLSIPLGQWDHGYKATALTAAGAAQNNSLFATLSSTNNSESDSDMTTYGAANTLVLFSFTGYMTKGITLSSASSIRYLNIKVGEAGHANLQIRGADSPTIIFAVPSGLAGI